MGEVVAHDFGKANREFADRLARLLKLSEDRKADIIADPIKYLDMAEERIESWLRFFGDLCDTLDPGLDISEMIQEPSHRPPETLIICAREYRRLKAAATMIRTHRIEMGL